ncbi:hypothetical protein ACS0TY_014400 [Phlomoides rotata]
MIQSLLLLMEDVKVTRRDNEGLKEENFFLKKSNEDMFTRLEEAESKLSKSKELEEEYLYLNVSHEDLFIEASCRIADCVELQKEVETLTKKVTDVEEREKNWLSWIALSNAGHPPLEHGGFALNYFTHRSFPAPTTHLSGHLSARTGSSYNNATSPTPPTTVVAAWSAMASAVPPPPH